MFLCFSRVVVKNESYFQPQTMKLSFATEEFQMSATVMWRCLEGAMFEGQAPAFYWWPLYELLVSEVNLKLQPLDVRVVALNASQLLVTSKGQLFTLGPSEGHLIPRSDILREQMYNNSLSGQLLYCGAIQMTESLYSSYLSCQILYRMVSACQFFTSECQQFFSTRLLGSCDHSVAFPVNY